MIRSFIVSVFLIAASGTSQAIILYGAGNSANTTSAGTTAPFASVAATADVNENLDASAVYIGNGYMITANHVNSFEKVTFNGTTFFNYAPGTVQRIGATDMKIFRLTTIPNVTAAAIYSGTNELTTTGTVIGYGVGRGATAINSELVAYGDQSTMTKRWGLNAPRSTQANYTVAGSGTYDAIFTSLGATGGLGANEAATVDRDSGSALFQQFSGQWFLTGVTSAVTSKGGAGTATFNVDSDFANSGLPIAGDVNVFNRVSSYSSAINAIIIPEPSCLVLTLAALPILLRRRR